MNRKIIFYAFSSQSWDSYVPILNEILDQYSEAKDHICVCAPSNNYQFKDSTSKSLFDFLSGQFTKTFKDDLQNSNLSEHVLVTTHIPDEKYGLSNALYIHVPHGSAFGNNQTADYLVACYQASDIYCGISPAEEEYLIQKCGTIGNTSTKFIATGCPKNDIFYNYIVGSQEEKNRIKSEIKQSMGIPLDVAVIFIGSHWTSRGILRRFGTSLIQALSTVGDKVHIIQGAHPNLWNNHVSIQTSDWLYKSLCNERDKGSAMLSLGVSDAKALLMSDIVIGDISSIAIEAALLEKPILLNIDKDSFLNEQIYKIYKGISVQFNGADDLLQAFLKGVNFPENREETFEKVKELFGYNIGNASKKIASTILDSAQ